MKDKYTKFNMSNTNGRRADITEAYTKYLKIIEEEFENGFYKWENFPENLGQYIFYKKAVEGSPEVFKDLKKLKEFEDNLKIKEYREAFNNLDKSKFLELPDGKKNLGNLDGNIEARARHYTSNLVKIGFTNEKRNITPVGRAYLNELANPDDFESLLPINSINLILLRQLAKLRIYNKNGDLFYSPFALLVYTLLKAEKDTISDGNVFKMLGLLNPNQQIPIDELDDFIIKSLNNYEDSEFEYNSALDGNKMKFKIPKKKLTIEEFKSYFPNRKSSEQVKIYYEFYVRNRNFVLNTNQKNLNELLKVIKNNKQVLNASFGEGKNIYKLSKKRSTNVNEFLENNKENVFLKEGYNNNLYYSKFYYGKLNNNVREYNRNFRKLILATGIFTSKNGHLQLAYKDILNNFFDLKTLKKSIFVKSNSTEMKFYEKNNESEFFHNITLSEIYNYENSKVDSIVKNIIEHVGVRDSAEAKKSLKNLHSKAFKDFVETKFTRKEVKTILKLFSNRENDKKIQEKVGVDCSVPTIYEYIVGLAWYHLSDKDYDLFSSFNLTMTADFLPEKFAGGGNGDIIINYEDEIIQIEATLMNANAQKRGEWEPVLRHATNLTIENLSPHKEVTTLFIADELDNNTINIWRAVASVPLESSKSVSKATVDNVKIMPLKNADLISMLENEKSSTTLISNIKESFELLPKEFDNTWREDILNFEK